MESEMIDMKVKPAGSLPDAVGFGEERNNHFGRAFGWAVMGLHRLLAPVYRGGWDMQRVQL
jgi:hypothetical protein